MNSGSAGSVKACDFTNYPVPVIKWFDSEAPAYPNRPSATAMSAFFSIKTQYLVRNGLRSIIPFIRKVTVWGASKISRKARHDAGDHQASGFKNILTFPRKDSLDRSVLHYEVYPAGRRHLYTGISETGRSCGRIRVHICMAGDMSQGRDYMLAS
jgi:hypothetical protein